MRRITSRFFMLVLCSAAAHAEDAARVFAAASLTNALTEIGELWSRALLHSPRLLLLDEPLSSLDERLKQQSLPS